MKRTKNYFAAALITIILAAGTVACDVPNAPEARKFNPVFLLIDSLSKTYHTSPDCEHVRSDAGSDISENRSLSVEEVQNMGIAPCPYCSTEIESDM